MAEPESPRLTFWGTRGSIAASGPGTARHGGCTACVSLTEGERTLVLDAGSGLRHFGAALPAARLPGRHSILLSHLHWDHLAGFPFFPALYEPAATIAVHGPDQPTAPIASVVHQVLAPALWPIPVRGTLEIVPVLPGAMEVEGFGVLAFRLAHAGVTLGYRITCQSGRIVSYVTDNEIGAMHPAQRRELVQHVRGSDVLIHDATWSEALRPVRAGWGHSSASEAVTLGVDAECAMVVLFHHDPDADDDALDRQVESVRRQVGGSGRPVVIAAADGLTLEL